MAWITPKTNFVSTDYYNYSDFNRVENNINEVRNYLNSIQYPIPSIPVVTNRTNTSIDYVSSINRIENNIKTLCTNFVYPPGFIAVKTWSNLLGFSHSDANRLEVNINALYLCAQKVYEGYKYCGATTCGGGYL